jgi:transposase
VAEKQTPARATTAARPVRQPLPTHLETERVVLEPVEVQQQPAGWRKLGEEVTEELDWKPAKFIKRLYIRPKYANADRIVIASLPARLIEKGLPGAGLLTQVIVSKYEDHLPLYRQEKIYRERHGVNLSRQTLCGWVEAAADWLAPIYREMKAALVTQDYLQVDETPIQKAEAKLLRLFNERMATTYSRRTYRTTTIGPAVFDGRVRNGNGSDHCGIVTKNYTKNIPRFRAGPITGLGHSLKTTHRNIGTTIRELNSYFFTRKKLRSSRTTD